MSGNLQLELLKTKNRIESLIQIIISIILSVLSVILFLAILKLFGFSFEAGLIYKYGIKAVITQPADIALIIFWAGPLILTALTVAIAFQAGMFNIGGQGQMAIGGVLAAIWAANIVPEHLPFMKPGIILLPTTILMGILGGAIWGYIPGLLKAKYGAHEVITTILLNLSATSIVLYLVGSQTYSPFVDHTSLNAYSQTEVINSTAIIPPIFSFSNFLNYSIVIILLTALIIHIVIFKLNFGYRIRAVGLNQDAARAAGIDVEKTIIAAMTLSGAVSGLAGALLVQGNFPYRYIIGMEGTRGFDGIAVALIGVNTPVGIIFAALLFGFLTQSRVSLDQNTSIPPELIYALQSFIVLFTAAPLISRKIYQLFAKEVKEVKTHHLPKSGNNSKNKTKENIENTDKSVIEKSNNTTIGDKSIQETSKEDKL